MSILEDSSSFISYLGKENTSRERQKIYPKKFFSDGIWDKNAPSLDFLSHKWYIVTYLFP